MTQTVTVTSKNQITIPISMAKMLNISPGDTLIAQSDGYTLKLQKSQDVLDSLAQSIEIPKKYHQKDIDFIIRDAKREFFKNKK